MRRFRGVLRDLAFLASSIGYGLEMVRGLIGVDAAESGPRAAVPQPSNLHEHPLRRLGDEFLLSSAVTFNQGVLSNIDAVDSALIGILGAAGAFTILTVDKMRELAVVPRWVAIGFLAASGLVSLYGYAHGFVGRHPRDVPRPTIFVPDFLRYGSKALARATRETVHRSEENLDVRQRKRVASLIAIAFLIAGAVVVTYARLSGVAVGTP
jgi:hypothetical protein